MSESSSTRGVRCLGGLRVDTVEAVAHHDLVESAAAWLAETWREHVEAESRTTTGEAVYVPSLAPAVDVRVTSRAGQYPVMLSAPHWRLQLSPWSGRARVILAAEALATYGLEWARLELERIAAWLYGDGHTWEISRLDICGDFVGMTPGQYADTSACVTRVTRVATYDVEDESPEYARVYGTTRRVETVQLGSAESRVSCVIYDKVRQARAKRLPWVETLLAEQGWDGAQDVTRVEVRLRRSGLDDIEGGALRHVSSLARWREWVPRVWRYVTHTCVRYCVPHATDSNRSRWETRADWRAVQAAVRPGELAVCRRTLAARSADERAQRDRRQLVRTAMRLAAQRDESVEALRTLVHATEVSGAPPMLALLAVAIGGEDGARQLSDDVFPSSYLYQHQTTAQIELMARIDTLADERRWREDAYYAWCDEPTSHQKRTRARATRR